MAPIIEPMTAAPTDLFELLDIPRREDSYSSLLRELLRHSPGLRDHVLAHGYPGGAPRLIEFDVELRTKLPRAAGIVDLLISGHDAENKRWELFIENKIDAGEAPDQTGAYLRACQSRVYKRAAGILLTLDGRPADASERVVSLTHAELGSWVEQSLSMLTDPVLRLAAEAYVRRACPPPPKARAEEIVGDLLDSPVGLQRWDAGLRALGRTIVSAAGSGWEPNPVRIQSPGHGNPGLQFHREHWWGQPIQDATFTRDNHNVHAEIELVPEDTWRLKIHFETEPYMTGKQLARGLDNLPEFEAMRDAFRTAIHDNAAEVPRWKMTNYRLQVCVVDLEVSRESTVGEAVRSIAEGLTEIGELVDRALAVAKGRTR